MKAAILFFAGFFSEDSKQSMMYLLSAFVIVTSTFVWAYYCISTKQFTGGDTLLAIQSPWVIGKYIQRREETRDKITNGPIPPTSQP